LSRAEDWAALASPTAYPDDPSAASGVEWIQTHLSHVFRTGARVYKFRKAVDLGFVRFATRAERNADCLREVALNRRLAPDVYLGVAPLRGATLGPCAESLVAEDVEHCVVMRRLPDARDALSLLEAGALSGRQLDALAQLLALFHATHALGAPAPFTEDEWRERCTRPASDNFESLAEADAGLAPPELLATARERALGFAAEHADRFERRRREGRAVDAHGDLHLQHIWYERDDEEPIAIDCLEFSESLRKIDAASEVAFVAMDLRYRRARRLGERFLSRYATESDDYDLYSLVDYFTAYRAGVRAKVAALAARDPGIAAAQREGAAESAHRHLALAAEALAPTPSRPTLVLVCGVVGSGKSSVAAALADRIEAVAIASDRVRKRQLGALPTERLAAGWGEGAYSSQQTDRTYAGMLTRAGPVVASGRSVILDATWSRSEHRARAVEAARRCGADTFLVEVCCDPAIARDRLARRARAGTDPSDAGPEALEASAAAFEPIDRSAARTVRVDTDRSDWRDTLDDVVRRIRGSA
jgi:aminoglycoside phosphotransferase family enzyme/predicted kinase